MWGRVEDQGFLLISLSGAFFFSPFAAAGSGSAAAGSGGGAAKSMLSASNCSPRFHPAVLRMRRCRAATSGKSKIRYRAWSR